MKLGEITIRDPFIFPDAAGRCYYLYGTTLKERGYAETGFYGFKSQDLKEWDGPFPVFIPDGSFWADSDFWAPEVHFYHGKYYMFATFRKDGFCRGTQILFSETPDGMFVPLTEKPVTPPDWECLDGTLFVDDNGIPYMIFCHEWLQVSDGEMCVMPLSADLREAAGEAQLLFRASEAPWSRELFSPGSGKYVTDGPFVFREDGKLKMLWSSMGEKGYAMGCAVSDSGTITGTWRHERTPVFAENGGHGMIFTSFDGKKYLTLHQPNISDEHPVFISLADKKHDTSNR